MERTRLFEGAERVRFSPAEAESFAPVVFSDARGEFLRQTELRWTPRPVYRLGPARGEGEVEFLEHIGPRRALSVGVRQTSSLQCIHFSSILR